MQALSLLLRFLRRDVLGLRILQTGKKGNYWSIDEIYVAMIEGLNSDLNGIDEVTALNREKTLFLPKAL